MSEKRYKLEKYEITANYGKNYWKISIGDHSNYNFDEFSRTFNWVYLTPGFLFIAIGIFLDYSVGRYLMTIGLISIFLTIALLYRKEKEEFMKNFQSESSYETVYFHLDEPTNQDLDENLHVTGILSIYKLQTLNRETLNSITYESETNIEGSIGKKLLRGLIETTDKESINNPLPKSYVVYTKDEKIIPILDPKYFKFEDLARYQKLVNGILEHFQDRFENMIKADQQWKVNNKAVLIPITLYNV